MGKVIRMENGVIRRLFSHPWFSVTQEEVIHVDYAGERIVSIYPHQMYAEFSEDFRDPTSHGPAIGPVMDYLQSEKYRTNLK